MNIANWRGLSPEMKDTIKRLAVEGAVIVVISSAWSGYRVSSRNSWTLGDFFEELVKSFFFLSYFYNYYGRARKLSDDKAKHRSLLTKQQELVGQLESATRELVGHTTGGDSYARLMMVNPGPEAFSNLVVTVVGKFAIPDASVNIIDVSRHDERIAALKASGDMRDFFRNDVQIRFGTLFPAQAALRPEVVPRRANVNRLRYELDWTARNGKWTQHVQLDFLDGRWQYATAVHRDGLEISIIADPGFPKNEDGRPRVEWSRPVPSAAA